MSKELLKYPRMVVGNYWKLWCCVFLAPFYFPFSLASATSLGDFTIRSDLNTPLVAEINLLLTDPEMLDSLRVNLGSKRSFDQAGLPRPNALQKLVFDPIVREDGSTAIRVSSKTPLDMEYLQLIIELNLASSTIERVYNLKFYPKKADGTSLVRIYPAEEPVLKENALKESELRISAKEIVTGTTYGPIIKNEYLIFIGNALVAPPDISLYQRLYAILQQNRHAFINGNMNLLREGVVLDIPTSETMSDVSRVLAMETFIRQVAEWQEYRSKSDQRATELGMSNSGGPEIKLMRMTMNELESEISRLQSLLRDVNLSQEGDNYQSEAMESREILQQDIERLEVAKNQLLKTIEELKLSSSTTHTEAADSEWLKDEEMAIVREMTVDDEGNMWTDEGSVSDVQLDNPVADFDQKNVENLLLGSSGSNGKELRSEISVLQRQVEDLMSAYDAQSEALALAEQEAAVYSAALEALDLTAQARGGDRESQTTTMEEPEAQIGTKKSDNVRDPQETIDNNVPNQAQRFLSRNSMMAIFSIVVVVLLILLAQARALNHRLKRKLVS